MSTLGRPAVSAELLEAARSGDRAALAGLLAAAQPDVRRYARVACRSPTDAEDAAQDALWLIYRRVGGLRVLDSFAGWVFAIVRRECLRIARRATGRSERPLGDDLLARLAVRDEVELRMDLASAIQSLPAHYAEVVVLRDVQEMTINEVAARLGLTRETVKARLHRARTLLREYLED